MAVMVRTNPSFHAITTISWILGIIAMLMMGINSPRFQTESCEQMCRVGRPNEPDSTNAVFLYGIVYSFLETAYCASRKGHHLHDLISQVFLRSLQVRNRGRKFRC